MRLLILALVRLVVTACVTVIDWLSGCQGDYYFYIFHVDGNWLPVY